MAVIHFCEPRDDGYVSRLAVSTEALLTCSGCLCAKYVKTSLVQTCVLRSFIVTKVLHVPRKKCRQLTGIMSISWLSPEVRLSQLSFSGFWIPDNVSIWCQHQMSHLKKNTTYPGSTGHSPLNLHSFNRSSTAKRISKEGNWNLPKYLMVSSNSRGTALKIVKGEDTKHTAIINTYFTLWSHVSDTTKSKILTHLAPVDWQCAMK